MKKKPTNTVRFRLYLGILLGILSLWSGISLGLGTAAIVILPPPWIVFEVYFTDAGRLFFHLGLTLIWTGIGFISALIGAFLSGILLHRVRTLEQASWPFLIISQTIPTIFLAPLFILWFGFGPVPRILIVFITCIFPILINFLSALDKVPVGYQEMLSTLGATKRQIFWILNVPMAISGLITGIKIAITYALVACVLSEWIGAQDGLGMYMALAFKNFSLEKSFAAVVLLSLTSYALVSAVNLVEKKLKKRLRRFI